MRVLVAAAQAPLRALVKAASNLADAPAYELVPSYRDLVIRLQGEGYKLVLIDFDLPELGGLKGLGLVRAAAGTRPIALFMAGASLELARRAITQGAQALVSHRLSPAGLNAAVTLVTEGRSLCITDHTAPLFALQRAAELSERELQVLTGLCEGLQNKEIAHAFAVQEVTVKMHVRAIIRKLGARNRTHAAMIARDLGIC